MVTAWSRGTSASLSLSAMKKGRSAVVEIPHEAVT